MNYTELTDTLKTYMSEEDLSLIDKYYSQAELIYSGMKRLTKEDYICHPIRVAATLADLKMDAITIGCALIHEAITLEKMTYEEIEEKFDENTAITLSSLSKMSHLKRTFTKVDNTEKYRRIIVGLAENPISLFIKLADRLDNLKTVDIQGEEHTKEIIDETEKIYIPIAHRLGIKTMKSELEDLCLRYGSPKEYQDVLNKINADKEELDSSLLKMRDEIIEILNEHNIEFEIVYRVKSVRGIYNKLKAGKKWNQIFDLLGLRLLVNKIDDCYLIIGLIHSKFRPIPKRFKDYIANPKNNMYQSLHTTVFGVDGRIYEIQIRTYEMNEIAEHGVASHWSYKEKTDGSKTSQLENKLANFRALIEMNDIDGNVDFFKDLNSNLSKEEMYIFTPKGDIIELPIESTPIDFAYKIHSQVGDTTVGALVNGKLVSLDYKLQDGDIVDLKTEKGKYPSKAWLKTVKTESAKSRIKSYWSKKEKEKSITTGKELISLEIKKRKLVEKEIFKEEYLRPCLEELKIDNLEELYIAVSSLKYTPTIIINKLLDIINPKKEDPIEKLLTNENIKRENKNSQILIAGESDILTTLSSCCNPVLGDEIIGFITKGNGVAVHRKNCKNIDINNERIIEVEWNKDLLDKFTTCITIYIDSSNDNLINILALATKEDIQILSINNKGAVKNNDIYELICKVKNINILQNFMHELSLLEFVNKVET